MLPCLWRIAALAVGTCLHIPFCTAARRQADVGREVNYHATALRPIEDDEACRGRSRRPIDSFKLRTGSVRSEVIPIRIVLRT